MSVTLHMVMSLDGFVAKRDLDVSWMDSSWSPYAPGRDLTAELVAETLRAIDCYVMGSRTYELALQLGWPYGDTPTVVVTSRELAPARPSVEFHSGDLGALVKKLEGKNVWLVGGPTLGREFLRLQLVDEVCLTVVPILLGDGMPLLRGEERKLKLKDITPFKNGMIDLRYQVIRGGEMP